GGPYPTIARALVGLVWIGLAAAVLRRARFARPSELAATCGWLLLWSVLLLTSAVYAHYLVPVIALAAVSEDARLQRLAFWLSLGGMAAYNVEWLATALGRDWLDSDSYRVLGSLVMLGPAAIAWLAGELRDGPGGFGAGRGGALLGSLARAENGGPSR